MLIDRKKAFSKAFWWGNAEHKLEKLTNWLLLFDVMVFWYFIYKKTFLVARIGFYLLLFVFFVHLIARFCHRREKKFHRIANL